MGTTMSMELDYGSTYMNSFMGFKRGQSTISLGYVYYKINQLEEEFPAFITNSRGLGLFCAFDLPSPIERDKLVGEMYKNRLMILGCGIQSVTFLIHHEYLMLR